MPQITNQVALLRDYTLQLVSTGPKDGQWVGQYLKCPICGYFVLKGAGYDECLCGNISWILTTLRVVVRKTPESQVEIYNAAKNAV